MHRQNPFRRVLYQKKYILVILIILLLTIAQIYTLHKTFILPTMERSLGLINEDAWMRAAILLEGDEFANYIAFLRDHIPENGRVLLPPNFRQSTFEHVGIMQFFLYPREIHNCGADEVEECVKRVSGKEFYILAVRDFPPRELAAETKDYVRFDDKIGLFIPRQVD